MALLEVTTEQILTLIRQLPAVSKRKIFEILRQELEIAMASDSSDGLDTDSQMWLDAELTEPLPTYEWRKEGVPDGVPVKYIPGQGLMILDAHES